MPYAAAPAVIGAESSNGDGTAQPRVPMVLFQHEGKIFQVPQEQWKPVYDQFAEQCKAEHDEVVALGGLHILGTERHEARRIDNQLRGRAGRPGRSGVVAILSVAGRRFDADFRRGKGEAVDVPAGNDGRRAD